MQSGGQYGLSEINQFVVARNSPPLQFAHSQDALHPANPFPHQYSLMQQQQQQQQQLDRYHAYPYEQLQNHLHQQPRLQLLQLQSQTHQQLQPPFISFPHTVQQQKIHACPQVQQAVPQISFHSDSSDMVSPVAPRPSSSQSRPVIRAKESSGDDDGTEVEKRSHGCNCWPNDETIALLRIRSELDKDFRDSTLKTQLWEEISRKLAVLGFNRSAKKCKEMFENAHMYYKKMKGGKDEGQDGNAFYAPHENNDSGGSIGDTAQAAGGHIGTQGHACPQKSDGKLAAAETSLIEVPETSSGLTLSSDSFNQDDSYERQRNDEHESKKKRKRRSWFSAKVFFEKLAKQLLEQQQTLHTKFLETIERREYESIRREEAFRTQELARLNREQELRAQERALAATRDAAVVTFLQNLTGQTIQLPTNPTGSFVSDTHDDTGKDTSDMNTSRWPKVEVHALIRLRSGLEPRFQEAGPKAQLWEEISGSMACMGYSRSAKRCKEKWENINKYFRKMKESCRKRPDNAKTCPYFHHLETLYHKGVLCSPSSKYNNLESQYENLQENRRDSGKETEDGNAEMLINFPATGNTSQLASIKNINSQFCRNYEDAMFGDHVLHKAKLNYALPDCDGNGLAVPSDLHVDVRKDGEGFLSSNRASKLERFVKEILELQQEQHQKLLEEYEKLEQTEERGQQQNDHLGQAQPQPNIQDNVELMSLVRKLADDSSQFSILAANKR